MCTLHLIMMNLNYIAENKIMIVYQSKINNFIFLILDIFRTVVDCYFLKPPSHTLLCYCLIVSLKVLHNVIQSF